MKIKKSATRKIKIKDSPTRKIDPIAVGLALGANPIKSPKPTFSDHNQPKTKPCKHVRKASAVMKIRDDNCNIDITETNIKSNFIDSKHTKLHPEDVGIGGGGYVDFSYCLDCGRIDGKWPLLVVTMEEVCKHVWTYSGNLAAGKFERICSACFEVEWGPDDQSRPHNPVMFRVLWLKKYDKLIE